MLVKVVSDNGRFPDLPKYISINFIGLEILSFKYSDHCDLFITSANGQYIIRNHNLFNNGEIH